MKRNAVYRCSVCGNIVELLQVGGGTLTCCDQPMELLEEASADTTVEKHVPFIETIEGGYRVKVGQSQDHPMAEAHYIVWIELHTDQGVFRKFLKPGDAPQADFKVGKDEKVTGAREYCNVHGLWKK